MVGMANFQVIPAKFHSENRRQNGWNGPPIHHAAVKISVIVWGPAAPNWSLRGRFPGHCAPDRSDGRRPVRSNELCSHLDHVS